MSAVNLLRPLPPMTPRTLYTEEHEAFRDTARRFFETEIAPYHEKWAEQQHLDRNIWNKAGELGLLCCTMPEQYGGSGVDRRYSAILMEEQAYALDSASGFALHSDIVANYILNFGNEEQKMAWLPKMATGEAIGAIAMTEPGTGSDLQSIRTTAVLDGDGAVVLHHLRLLLAAGSEEDKRAYSARLFHRAEDAIELSLTLGRADTEARRFAFMMVLRRKGRVMDVMAAGAVAARLRADPARPRASRLQRRLAEQRGVMELARRDALKTLGAVALGGVTS